MVCILLGSQKKLKYCVTGIVHPVFCVNKQMKLRSGVQGTLHRDATASHEENS